MMLDYETLKIIWFFLIGALCIGFAVTGGWDFGIAILLPFIGKNDDERRVIINSIGPTWEGNQVWLVTAAAALFAAWPILYATIFSGLYFALLIVLLALILRPPGIDYRSKIPKKSWRTFWDCCLFISGFIPCLLIGIAFGNLILGLPFEFDNSMRSVYHGHFFELLSPYALLAGLFSLEIFIFHGSIYLQVKTEAPISTRAMKSASLFGILFLINFITTLLITLYFLPGYTIQAMPDPNTSFAPMLKTVSVSKGSWMENFIKYPLGILAPIAVVFTMLAIILSVLKRPSLALIMSALTMAALTVTVGFILVPFILPSSVNPNHSLTIWDACSSKLTLTWMFAAVIIFLPIILIYTSFVFRVMRGKVRIAEVRENNEAY